MDTLLDSSFGYVVVLLATFLGGAALILGLRDLTGGRGSRMRARLVRLTGRPLAADEAPEAARPGLLAGLLGPIARVATPTDRRELGRLRTRLTHAGLRAPHAANLYLASKVILCLGLGLGLLALNANLARPLGRAIELTVFLMGIGFYAPNAWLAGRIRERQRTIERALPDALDLLVTCVESGLGLDAALNRVAGEIRLASPLLADELALVAAEMRAGLGRGDAFRRLAERTGVEELRALSAVIIQTQIFGTSIARSLRVQSEGMRVRRMQRAEERAGMASVKMTIPLIVFIMPSLFAILLGPAAVRIYRVLVPALGGSP